MASGLLAGFLSGLLGLGGGILLTPLLLFVPRIVGLEGLDVKEITGLTMTQGLVGGISGLIRHHSFGFVSWRLVGYMGLSAGAAALAGAVLSSNISDSAILVVFASMALIASALFLAPAPRERDEPEGSGAFRFNVPLAVSLGSGVGFAGGLVGQAGSFLLIPLMVYVLRVPTRFAIGSNLGIILFSAAAGLAGKLGTAQVPLLMAVALIGGTVPGALLGSWASRKAQPRLLRYVLAVVVSSAALGIWLDVLL